MAQKKKPLPPRAVRREAERSALKLARDRERLAALEAGGSPERPIELASASQVEGTARSTPCARCGGEVRVEEHLAETIGGARLRVVHVACPACGYKRPMYFRLGGPLLN
jgi:DNA-directed RNA polymerase subunit RPC12/RpoP